MLDSQPRALDDTLDDNSEGFRAGRALRRHALLATRVRGERVALVDGVDAWLHTRAGSFPLAAPRVQPRRRFTLPDGTLLTQEIFAGRNCVVLTWRLGQPCGDAELVVRPLLCGCAPRDEPPQLDFQPHPADGTVSWRLDPALPRIVATSSGVYSHRPRRQRHDEPAMPGMFTLWPDARGEAALIFATGALPHPLPALRLAERLRAGDD
jgi:hypothetical protein